MVGKLGKTLYADAYTGEAGARFNVYTPVFEKGRFVGVLVGVYSFDSLLKQLGPLVVRREISGSGARQQRLYPGAGNPSTASWITPVNYSIPRTARLRHGLARRCLPGQG